MIALLLALVFPFATMGDLVKEVTGFDQRMCSPDTVVSGYAIRGDPPKQEWVLYAAGLRWAAAHFPEGGEVPDVIFHGHLNEERLVVDETLPFREGLNSCEWLTQTRTSRAAPSVG